MPTRVEKKVKKERIVEIDFIRGVLIWFMIVDHLFFDFWGIVPYFEPFDARLIALSDIGVNYWNWPLRIGVRFAILSLFFLISGISSYFSKNNLKRGLMIFGVGVIISLGFFIFGKTPMGDGEYIFFGAITCFGVSILIYWLLRFLFKKIFPKHEKDFKWIALGLGVLTIAIGLMFDCWNIANAGPEYVYEINWSNFMGIILGRYQDGSASDWLPLFPYLGFLFIGSFIGELLYKERKSYFKPLPTRPKKEDPTIKKVTYYGGIMPYKGIKNVITFSGHYSLFFYLLHQIVLIAVIGIVLLSMGYTLNL